MIILNRKEIRAGLNIKIQQLSDDELLNLYEQLFEVTPIIMELVNEEYIEQAIWDEFHVTVTAQETAEGIEIIPDSYMELADAWEVEVDSNDFWYNMEELEKFWSEQIGKDVDGVPHGII